MPEAILFDFDGLILDTEVPVYEAWRENYEAHGQELPLDIYVQCVGSDFAGFDPKTHLQSMVSDSIDWEHWDSRREQSAREHTHRLSPFPGVVDLLTEANSLGIPCVVASSSPRSWVESHLNRLDLLSHFETTRCLDDVRAPKPAPDLFLAAAQAVQTEPRKAIVLEDSLNGLKAARAAAIDCVIIPNKVTSSLNFEGAAAVLETLATVTVADLRAIKNSTGG